MKKQLIAAAAALVPALMFGQTAIDAYSISQPDHRGTARFMSMGGAFTALGGDISTLNQNPGGIGVYRSSEIGLTLGLDLHNTSSLTDNLKVNKDKTSFGCNNFGYIGAVYTNSDVMPYFNWGASYSRTQSFDRAFKGGGAMRGSLSNYVAGYTSAENWTTSDLSGDNTYNPYQDSFAPWMSILGYNSYMINPMGMSDSKYRGLWQDGSAGSAAFDVREKGHVDEYSLNFGGNFVDILYWGVGFGVTDVDYKSSVYYEEDIEKARIPDFDGSNYTGTATGAAGYGLDSWKHISGTGFNFKFGLILKPINEVRIGLAVHTPTFYNLKQEGWAAVDYGYGSGKSGYVETDEGYLDYFEWKLRTPWRLLTGISGVIGKKAILSLDYEYRPMQNMSVRDADNNEYIDVNNDIKDYYTTTNIIRLGAEYRLDRHWSVRTGYQIQSSPTKAEARDGKMMVYTSGPDDTETTPSYSFDKNTQYISCGLGYRYNNFYVGAAYVNKRRESTWRAFTPNSYDGAEALSSKITAVNNQIVLSAGFKF